MTQSTNEFNASTNLSVHGNGSASSAPNDPVTEILKTSRTIAVVGLSNRKFRSSYGVADYLKSVGYRIIPVNPLEKEVLGEKSYARAIWMQEGVIHRESAERARRAGLFVQMNSCILKEHVRRLRLTRDPAEI